MMPKVKLKVSMIFGGSFHRFGTVLDREMIPLNLRKAKNFEDPNTPDPTVEVDAGLEEFYDELNSPEPVFEEELEPPKFKRKLR